MELTPIEEIMYGEMIEAGIEDIADIKPQHWIGKYRVDFLLQPKEKGIKGLIVECDGRYHLTDEVYKKDQIRERELERQGFRVIRFSGRLLYDFYVRHDRDDASPIDAIRFYLQN